MQKCTKVRLVGSFPFFFPATSAESEKRETAWAGLCLFPPIELVSRRAFARRMRRPHLRYSVLCHCFGQDGKRAEYECGGIAVQVWGGGSTGDPSVWVPLRMPFLARLFVGSTGGRGGVVAVLGVVVFWRLQTRAKTVLSTRQAPAPQCATDSAVSLFAPLQRTNIKCSRTNLAVFFSNTLKITLPLIPSSLIIAICDLKAHDPKYMSCAAEGWSLLSSMSHWSGELGHRLECNACMTACWQSSSRQFL